MKPRKGDRALLRGFEGTVIWTGLCKFESGQERVGIRTDDGNYLFGYTREVQVLDGDGCPAEAAGYEEQCMYGDIH